MDKLDKLISFFSNLRSKEFGENGSLQITSASGTVVGNYGPVKIVEDTVFDTGTVTNNDGLAAGGKTYKAGDIVYGIFTSIGIASGTVDAYYRK